MLFPLRLAIKVVAAVATALVLYVGVTGAQVWSASRRDEARPATAIIVLGAAQYNGKPSPVLAARLEHALALYRRGLAPVIVVTGGRKEGDRVTEATAAANWLIARHVPDSAIRREVQGTTTWASLAAAASFLAREGRTDVLLVSDPFHMARLDAIASEVGLHGHTSPTRTSPIGGAEALRHMARETVTVAIGRVVGFRRLAGARDIARRVPLRFLSCRACPRNSEVR